MSQPKFIHPQWPAPGRVRALCTTRHGGVSMAPYQGLNLGDHVGDDPLAVQANRVWLAQAAKLPGAPRWLEQVHGCAVLEACGTGQVADACVARGPHQVCVVLTADCLPLLICDRFGGRVAAVHAGWRGLHAGVIERTVEQLGGAPQNLLVWLGPAIGPEAFEVGEEVREAFAERHPLHLQAFGPGRPGRWLANLYQLARQVLEQYGVTAVYGGDYCTYRDQERFFSYRRDGRTGRMASLIWMEP